MGFLLEISSVLLGLAYLFFLIREHIICWFFGISSSLLSIALFYRTGLYSEAILYFYYVGIGCYGYQLWRKKSTDKSRLRISSINMHKLLYLAIAATCLAFLLGYVFDEYTNASSSYLDAFTTMFSFLASYLEARKIISAWLFWIVINSITLMLYAQEDLYVYFGLTFIYLIFSFVGYLNWKKSMHCKTNKNVLL